MNDFLFLFSVPTGICRFSCTKLMTWISFLEVFIGIVRIKHEVVLSRMSHRKYLHIPISWHL